MDINKQCKKYILQTIFIFAVMNSIVIIVQKMWGLDLLAEMIVSSSFLLVTGVVIALIWRWVVSSHKESLPTFFTAVSGFRLLLALGVMFGWYLADKNDTMLQFFMVFMAYYVVSLVHHSFFFARLSNRS
ncbi:MAG: hypothetical protein IKQ86_01115 [Prevotella sp.]|jgi:uncharacterized membrane protein|nr:hypothetical protein [Prevotella sp.]